MLPVENIYDTLHEILHGRFPLWEEGEIYTPGFFILK